MLELPNRLATALESDWSRAIDPIANASSLFTIGRGNTLAIASEAALKLKETCLIHAEAFSAAEVHHGPIALARNGFAALAFVPEDQAKNSVLNVADRHNDARRKSNLYRRRRSFNRCDMATPSSARGSRPNLPNYSILLFCGETFTKA